MTPTRPYAEVIGDPIDHSLSPTIHGFWLETLGIKADYRRAQVGREGFRDYLANRRSDRLWRGCNVTMPLKLDALSLAEGGSDRAVGAGAANILIPRDGRIAAGNTDVGAVLALVGKLAEAGAPMAAITLLGTGGAARAALMGLHLLGLTEICIQSRDLGEAYKLAVQFGLSVEPVRFDAVIACDGLINATPLGMAGQPPLDIDLGAMPDKGWLFDFVTSPHPTALIRQARNRGLTMISGIDMLIEQAADSFKLLFGTDAPRDKDAALREKLGA